ncbi:MAG: alpha/beta hydrolase [Candidatus Puniceispirillum sp.]|nr:alpha/beta hydrolase [Candidatus Pelagibacter sp.]MBA4283246.1 alpha/beta hydrolase [Candidatus Puniceispirillum sp.]
MADIFIEGPAGRIEAKYTKGHNEELPVVLILHPDPRQEGTMHNKVVYTLYKAFAESGFQTLRINFRGVGLSEGVSTEGDGEIEDAIAALHWIKQKCPLSQEIWLSGFSFGAWVSLNLLMKNPTCTGFVAISPPTSRFNFNFLSPCPVSGLIVQGTSDDIVPYESVTACVQNLKAQPNVHVKYEIIEKANHFFVGYLDVLSAKIKKYIG